jgi:diguanylate cyclase (GGDEF)-like protein
LVVLVAALGALSLAAIAVVAVAAQRERAIALQIGGREAALGILERTHNLERRLRLLRAAATVRHRIALADRASVERSLMRVEDSIAAAPALGLGARLREVQAAWQHVSDRSGAVHDVDRTLGAAVALEVAITERSELESEPNEIVADAIEVYLHELPTIDDRIDQERNLVEGAVAAHRASTPSELAVEILEYQWRRAYDSAIGPAEQIRSKGGSSALLDALRRLGVAGSRFDAAVRYVARSRRPARADVAVVARRGDEAALTIDASASAAATIAANGYAVREADERAAFARTASYALVAWILGILLAFATAHAVRHRQRDAGERLDAGPERVAAMQAQLEAIFAGASLGVAILDADGRVVRHNSALKDLLARVGDSVIGARDERFAGLLSGDRAGFTVQHARELGGKTRYFQSDLSPIRADGDSPRLALAIVRDVTEAREIEARLRFEARHDTVSRLPNRAHFYERLVAALAHSDGPAVVFLDLASDASPSSLGYTGDEILAAIAARLAGSVDVNDFVARYDGSTFVVLLRALPDRASILAAVDRLLARLQQPLGLGEQDVHVAAFAGVAVADRPYSDPSEIVRDAEIAMYDARAHGLRAALFAPAMRDRSARRLALVSQLRRALERDQLYLAFQPLVAAGSGDVRGFEVLLRWEHPELGNVSPAEFIPIAEEVGCIDVIGRWVLDRGCAELAKWRALGAGAQNCTIAINVAVRELSAADYAAYVTRTLARHALEPRDLVLEVTESTALRGDSAAAKTLAELRAAGVALAIDDFGTGYSSLCYLHDFAFDQLKIDGSFVRGPGDGLASPPIVTMLVSLARTLGVEVVAECVETAAQAEALTALGIDTLQGYYFGRPVSSTLVPEYLCGRVTPSSDALSAGLAVSRATDLLRDHRGSTE